MIGSRFKVDTKKADLKLNRLRRRLDKNIILRLLGQRFIRWVDMNFRQEGIEMKWKALSPGTIAGRRGGRASSARFRGQNIIGSNIGSAGAKILQDTGRLKQSFTDRIIGDTVHIGTQSKIAEYHHFGTKPYTIVPVRAKVLVFMTSSGVKAAKRVNHPGLPARPLLPTKFAAERIAHATVETFVKQQAASI